MYIKTSQTRYKSLNWLVLLFCAKTLITFMFYIKYITDIITIYIIVGNMYII